MFKNFIVTLAAVFTFFAPLCFGDIIELKDGRRIEGTVVEKTDREVVISREEGKIVFSLPLAQIKNIKKTSPETDTQKTESETLPARIKGFFTEKLDGFSDKNREIKKEQLRREALKKYREEKYKREVEAARKTRKNRQQEKKSSKADKKTTKNESAKKRSKCNR